MVAGCIYFGIWTSFNVGFASRGSGSSCSCARQMTPEAAHRSCARRARLRRGTGCGERQGAESPGGLHARPPRRSCSLPSLSLLPTVLGGRAPELRLVEIFPGPRAGVPRRALWSAVRADCVGALDSELAVLDRIHARQRRAPSDALLRLLRARPRQHDRRRLRGQPADAFPLLRGADARDVPAGHAPWRRGSETRRPYLSRRCSFCTSTALLLPGDRLHLDFRGDAGLPCRAESSQDKRLAFGATVLARALHVRDRQGGDHAVSSLAAGGDGCARRPSRRCCTPSRWSRPASSRW